MEIIGRVTADAKVITLKDERKVVNFNVALNDSYKPKNSNDIKKITTFVQCSYWVNSTIAPYLTKGTLVELYGRIGVSAYSSLDGEAKGTLTFHVNNLKLHGKSKASNEEAQTKMKSVNEVPVADDLPF